MASPVPLTALTEALVEYQSNEPPLLTRKRSYQKNKRTELASKTPRAILTILAVRSAERKCWMLAPKANQMKQLGSAARRKSRPKPIAWVNAVPLTGCRYVLTALTLTSHDFGLIH